MSKKLYLLIAASMVLLSSCSQTSDTIETSTIIPSARITTTPAFTETPTVIHSPTSQPSRTPEQPTTATILTSADLIQINLFQLVPPDFLGAGYTNLGLIMEDPDLKTAFESIPGVSPFLDWQVSGSPVDRMISFSTVPDGLAQAAIGIVYILHGDFTEVSLPELVQESSSADPVLMEYQGFELMVEEQGDPFNSAYLILDQSTIVFGEETGVKAVIDTSLGLESSPLADLGGALPLVLFASVFNHCPQYQDFGCTAMVVPGLALGSSPGISLLHVYEFKDFDMAASAQDTIRESVECGTIAQAGSIKIVPDRFALEGRFIILEDLISVEDIGNILE